MYVSYLSFLSLPLVHKELREMRASNLLCPFITDWTILSFPVFQAIPNLDFWSTLPGRCQVFFHVNTFKISFLNLILKGIREELLLNHKLAAISVIMVLYFAFAGLLCFFGEEVPGTFWRLQELIFSCELLSVIFFLFEIHFGSSHIYDDSAVNCKYVTFSDARQARSRTRCILGIEPWNLHLFPLHSFLLEFGAFIRHSLIIFLISREIVRVKCENWQVLACNFMGEIGIMA